MTKKEDQDKDECPRGGAHAISIEIVELGGVRYLRVFCAKCRATISSTPVTPLENDELVN